ncbi:hypothetical protein A2U01_0106886, partial [Trifolium medium]|nr:hypothetical protein [Trifolium medium]
MRVECNQTPVHMA